MRLYIYDLSQGIIELLPQCIRGEYFVLEKVTSYIAQHPILGISQTALHLTFSIEHYLGFSFSHVANDAQILLIHKYPPMSIARYSYIQLNKLEQQYVCSQLMVTVLVMERAQIFATMYC